MTGKRELKPEIHVRSVLEEQRMPPDQDRVDELIMKINKLPDYSTPSKKRRLVEETFRRARNGFASIGREDAWINERRRKKVVLEVLERVQEIDTGMKLNSPEESIVGFEALSLQNYELLEEEYSLVLAASLWILDELRLSGKLYDAFQYLPSDIMDIYDVWIPADFYHPCYEYELIQSVAHTISLKNSRGSCAEQFRGLVSLLDGEKVNNAVNNFKALQWDAVQAWIKVEAYFDQQAQEILDELKGMLQSSALSARQHDYGKRKLALLEKSLDMKDIRQDIGMNFCENFAVGTRKIHGIRQLGKALDVTVGDPFELCFALIYLIANDDDSIWLMRAGTAAAMAAGRLLPWHGKIYEPDEEDVDRDEEDDRELDGRPYNWNGWLDRKRAKEKIDLYRPSVPGGTNPAQEIYNLSRGIVPAGMHPFSQEREQMKEKNIPHADLIADWAEILFLSSYRAAAANLRHGWDWSHWGENHRDEDDHAAWDQADPMPDDNGSDFDADTVNDGEKDIPVPLQDVPSPELQKAQKELRSARMQIKNLRKTISEMRRSADEEIAKKSRELKILQMEHRELADLRELIFNRENDVQEKTSADITYPYETQKRTVIFGGHATFLKAIRQMLPDVRYVDTANFGFDPEIVRNADVVWIQTNCISHSQYGNILRLTRQHGIQLRYFAYASAEKCAEQLVQEDR